MMELDKLTNNKLRTAFVDNFKSWILLTENSITGEKVYHFQLENGAAFAVKTKLRHSLMDDKVKELPEEYFLLNVKVDYNGKKNVFRIVDGTVFYDCLQNKSILIDFIKELQRGAVK